MEGCWPLQGSGLYLSVSLGFGVLAVVAVILLFKIYKEVKK